MGTGFSNGKTSYAALRGPAEAEAARRDDMRASDPEFESKINDMISDRLKHYNERDTDQIKKHLDDMLGILGEEMQGSLETIYGGSIKRHTYVDGLSDVDALLLIDESDLADHAPETVKRHAAEGLRYKLRDAKEIKIGDLAVTVVFKDGCEIQLLPAMRSYTGVVIQERGRNRWSGVVHPKKFAEKLTETNKKMKGKLVPVIKIFKGINAALPQNRQLTGYHIESLAIKVFKGYDVEGKSYKNILEHLCACSSALVMSPIRDRSNQSLHVDDYLGPAGSGTRASIKSALDNVVVKMRRANAGRVLSDWDEILGGP